MFIRKIYAIKNEKKLVINRKQYKINVMKHTILCNISEPEIRFPFDKKEISGEL